MGNDLQMTYVMLRLNRWRVYVCWLTSAGVSDPRPAGVVSQWGTLMRDRVQQDRGADTCCPVDKVEAQETQRCVAALPEYLRDTVVEDYLVGGTQQQKAKALGIQEKAFRNRRMSAHTVLLELFNLAAAGLPLQVITCRRGRPPVVAVASAENS